MTSFIHKYIENPKFLKWIFNTNPAIDIYGEQYLLEQPEMKTRIPELKDRIIELRFSNDMNCLSEKTELRTRFVRKINNNFKQTKIRVVFHCAMKYAAIALILFGIWGLVVYTIMGKETVFYEFVKQAIQVYSITQRPLLITSNCKNANHIKTNSTVEYSKSEVVVLNIDSFLQTTNVATNPLVIPYGNQSRVVSSDNKVVWLNSGNQLKNPTLFIDKIQEILSIGESFFEVAKNQETPFIGNTSIIDILVLGTNFKISTYRDDKLIQTVLKEGGKTFQQQETDIFGNDFLIKQNQMGSFNKISYNKKIYEVVTDYYTFWTKDLIGIDEIGFIRLMKKLVQLYTTSFNFSDTNKATMVINGKINIKANRKEVMEYLEKVSLSKFEQINKILYNML